MHAWKGFSGSLHDQWTMLRFNAPQALALEIKKSLPWADGHQLHFMMHLSFCGWGVLISAGSREMSQNTWFLNVGKETGRERDSQAEKQPLHKRCERVQPLQWGCDSTLIDTFHLEDTQVLFLSPGISVSVKMTLLRCAQGGGYAHFIYEKQRKVICGLIETGRKKPPSVTSLSRGGVSPTLKALAFAARDHQWAVTSAVYPNTHLMPTEGNGQICVRRRFLVGWDFFFFSPCAQQLFFFFN